MDTSSSASIRSLAALAADPTIAARAAALLALPWYARRPRPTWQGDERDRLLSLAEAAQAKAARALDSLRASQARLGRIVRGEQDGSKAAQRAACTRASLAAQAAEQAAKAAWAAFEAEAEAARLACSLWAGEAEAEAPEAEAPEAEAEAAAAAPAAEAPEAEAPEAEAPEAEAEARRAPEAPQAGGQAGLNARQRRSKRRAARRAASARAAALVVPPRARKGDGTWSARRDGHAHRVLVRLGLRSGTDRRPRIVRGEQAARLLGRSAPLAVDSERWARIQRPAGRPAARWSRDGLGLGRSAAEPPALAWDSACSAARRALAEAAIGGSAEQVVIAAARLAEAGGRLGASACSLTLARAEAEASIDRGAARGSGVALLAAREAEQASGRRAALAAERGEAAPPRADGRLSAPVVRRRRVAEAEA